MSSTIGSLGRPATVPSGHARPAAVTLVAWAAAIWAGLFALQSFFYAAGGTAGASTFPPSLMEPVLAGDRSYLAVLWITGVLKVLAGLLALAALPPAGRVVPRWVLVPALWTAAAIMAGYEGVASFGHHLLMAAGVLDVPPGLGETSLAWHLALWDPWWFAGGILFAILAISSGRGLRAAREVR